MPTKNPLFQINKKPTEQLVRDARNNIEELISELKSFASYLENNETEMFYDVFVEVEEAIKILSDVKRQDKN